MLLAVIASLSDTKATYGIRDKEGHPISQGDFFYSGDSIGVVDRTKVIAALLIQAVGEPPTDEMRISVAEVNDHKIGEEKNSMLVKLGRTKPVPGFPAISITVTKN
jgi:hypothetical protein